MEIEGLNLQEKKGPTDKRRMKPHRTLIATSAISLDT